MNLFLFKEMFAVFLVTPPAEILAFGVSELKSHLESELDALPLSLAFKKEGKTQYY